MKANQKQSQEGAQTRSVTKALKKKSGESQPLAEKSNPTEVMGKIREDIVGFSQHSPSSFSISEGVGSGSRQSLLQSALKEISS